MAEATVNGNIPCCARSLVPIWRNTMSGQKRITSPRSHWQTLAIVRPPTPCHWTVTKLVRCKLRWYSGVFLTIKSRRWRINECPKMRTHGWPIKRRTKVEITCQKMLTRGLLVTRWCTEQGEGAVICTIAYISLVFTGSPGSQFPRPVFIYTSVCISWCKNIIILLA